MANAPTTQSSAKTATGGGELFGRVALVGLGLIGSSLARVMKREGLAGHIAGVARSEKTRNRAQELGFVDSITADAAEAATDADLVVICTPIGAYAGIARAITGRLKPGAILADVGSVKQAVIDYLAPAVTDRVHLVPFHQVAGTEHSGPDAGFASLF